MFYQRVILNLKLMVLLIAFARIYDAPIKASITAVWL